jgi:hypothetical protein
MTPQLASFLQYRRRSLPTGFLFQATPNWLRSSKFKLMADGCPDNVVKSGPRQA